LFVRFLNLQVVLFIYRSSQLKRIEEVFIQNDDLSIERNEF